MAGHFRGCSSRKAFHPPRGNVEADRRATARSPRHAELVREAVRRANRTFHRRGQAARGTERPFANARGDDHATSRHAFGRRRRVHLSRGWAARRSAAIIGANFCAFIRIFSRLGMTFSALDRNFAMTRHIAIVERQQKCLLMLGHRDRCERNRNFCAVVGYRRQNFLNNAISILFHYRRTRKSRNTVGIIPTAVLERCMAQRGNGLAWPHDQATPFSCGGARRCRDGQRPALPRTIG